MKKAVIIAWLVLTIIPILSIPFSAILMSMEMYNVSSQRIDKELDLFLINIVATQIIIFILIASYLIYLFSASFVSKGKKQQQYLPFVSQCRDNVTEPFYDPGGARVVDLVRRIR